MNGVDEKEFKTPIRKLTQGKFASPESKMKNSQTLFSYKQRLMSPDIKRTSKD